MQLAPFRSEEAQAPCEEYKRAPPFNRAALAVHEPQWTNNLHCELGHQLPGGHTTTSLMKHCARHQSRYEFVYSYAILYAYELLRV